jgi:peptidoglycan biosynthesis protein MviN/MurJ (putative lipid II flippase)
MLFSMDGSKLLALICGGVAAFVATIAVLPLQKGAAYICVCGSIAAILLTYLNDRRAGKHIGKRKFVQIWLVPHLSFTGAAAVYLLWHEEAFRNQPVALIDLLPGVLFKSFVLAYFVCFGFLISFALFAFDYFCTETPM